MTTSLRTMVEGMILQKNNCSTPAFRPRDIKTMAIKKAMTIKMWLKFKSQMKTMVKTKFFK